MEFGLSSFKCECGRNIGRDYLSTERVQVELSQFYRFTCQACGRRYVEKMLPVIDITPIQKLYGITPPEEPTTEPDRGTEDGGLAVAPDPTPSSPEGNRAVTSKRRTVKKS